MIHTRLFDEMSEVGAELRGSAFQCTYHQPYEKLCGRLPDDPVHPRDDERMGQGRHVWRHDTKDAWRLRR